MEFLAIIDPPPPKKKTKRESSRIIFFLCVHKETAANSEILACRKKNERGWIAASIKVKFKRQLLRKNNDLGPEQDTEPLLEVRWTKANSV